MTSALPTNYFDLFEIPVSYDIDLNEVQHRYRQLQKAAHPDRYASASSQERRISMQQTSFINHALHTLKHPVERAVYLLQLKGLDFSMDNQTTMDADFLMQQMAMREALEAVRDQDDPIAETDRLSAKTQADLDITAAEFSRAYDADDIEAAREAVRKLQFLYKAKTEIDDLAATIEDELL